METFVEELVCFTMYVCQLIGKGSSASFVLSYVYMPHLKILTCMFSLSLCPSLSLSLSPLFLSLPPSLPFLPPSLPPTLTDPEAGPPSVGHRGRCRQLSRDSHLPSPCSDVCHPASHYGRRRDLRSEELCLPHRRLGPQRRQGDDGESTKKEGSLSVSSGQDVSYAAEGECEDTDGDGID